jgi:phytoene dehydrogenase-like protein
MKESIKEEYWNKFAVVEQHSIPGGCCTSFQRKGFHFDVGTDLFPGGGKGEIIYTISSI